jgi:hypothetical protein
LGFIRRRGLPMNVLTFARAMRAQRPCPMRRLQDDASVEYSLS